MAGSGFEVVMSDLLTAASTFSTESQRLGSLIPADGPARVDGGSGDINAALNQTMGAIGVLNHAVASDISAHAQKLRAAHNNYQNTELTNTMLAYDLTGFATGFACPANPGS
jgi:ABC-type phosphate transport system substrate-binding protein